MYITPIQCRNESIIINIFNKNVNLKKKDLKKKIKVLNNVKTHTNNVSLLVETSSRLEPVTCVKQIQTAS